MTDENLQEANNDNIETRPKIVKVFGICTECKQEVGLDATGEFIGCMHHLYTVNRELINIKAEGEKIKDNKELIGE